MNSTFGTIYNQEDDGEEVTSSFRLQSILKKEVMCTNCNCTYYTNKVIKCPMCVFLGSQ